MRDLILQLSKSSIYSTKPTADVISSIIFINVFGHDLTQEQEYVQELRMEIIFDPSLIALKQNISRAEEAIELAGSLLARRQICSAEYVNEMLTVYEDFGAAIVIDDGIAMPHARPEKGALQTGFSLVTTATPISFGHDEFDPVSVVIAIAGADADSHIKMIQLIASLIESDIVTFLQQENDVNSVLHFIQKQME